ncbi:MAG: VWA domain-containing protein [Planctomycetes bacterium]|nr:VWA domain-containing protein [Planctomycetota bacterium]
MTLRSLLMCTAAVLLTSGLGYAQGTGGMNPGAGTGTGGGAPAPGTTGKPQSELDLPMGPPAAPVIPPAVVPEEDDDDPRDTPPPTIYGEEIDTETDTIIYVLDISCSMGWDSQSYTTLDGRTRRGPRIDRAKAELARSIMGLSDNFMFNLIAYDCGSRQWQRSMVEADDGNKQSAIAWSMALSPTGATGTGPATALGLSDKDNMSVILLTDGAPNCGASGASGHRSMISSANSQGASINVFGIAASGSYRAFCQAVAGDSGGSYFDVP